MTVVTFDGVDAQPLFMAEDIVTRRRLGDLVIRGYLVLLGVAILLPFVLWAIFARFASHAQAASFISGLRDLQNLTAAILAGLSGLSGLAGLVIGRYFSNRS